MAIATKTKTRTVLESIAMDMYERVAPGEWCRTKLANGLDIILQRIDDRRWRLALAREGVYPSETEVTTCRRYFDVPDTADEQRSPRQYHHPKTRRVIEYRRVEITWTED